MHTSIKSTDDGTAFAIAGNPKNPCVILIHGLGLSMNTWDGYIDALAENHYVLRYDLYDHGQSGPLPERASLTVFSEQIRALMQTLSIDQACLIGFSLGGMINRRFAMDYPKLVNSLIILNSPHERGEEQQRLVEERAAQTDEGGPAATIETTLERWFTPTFRQNNHSKVDKVRQGVLSNDPKAYTGCRQVLANGVIELIRPQPAITHPTLVITCENDSGSTPEMSQAIGKEIPGSQVKIIAELQHMGLVEQPQQFLQPILRFLKDTHHA